MKERCSRKGIKESKIVNRENKRCIEEKDRQKKKKKMEKERERERDRERES